MNSQEHTTTQVFLEKTPSVPEEQVDELEELLRRKYSLATGFGEPHQLSVALQKAFRAFDLMEYDMLSPKEFFASLSKMNCAGQRKVVDKLFNRYDLKAQGKFSVRAFCDGLFGLSPIPNSCAEFRDLSERVREILKRRGGDSFRGFTRTFRIMDDNGNRKLGKEELRTGLQDYGLQMSPDELKLVYKFFDRDGTGNIDVTEFIVGIRGQMSPQRRALVMQAYLKLEKNGDGVVTMDDLAMIYHTENHPLVKEGKKTAQEVLKEFSSIWNKNGDDVITFDEFVEYYDDLSASIDNDAYFELMLRNAWHLSGGSGFTECTTTRRVLVHHLDGTCTVEEVDDDLGLDFNNTEAIKMRLKKQGVSDILKVEVC